MRVCVCFFSLSLSYFSGRWTRSHGRRGFSLGLRLNVRINDDIIVFDNLQMLTDAYPSRYGEYIGNDRMMRRD